MLQRRPVAVVNAVDLDVVRCRHCLCVCRAGPGGQGVCVCAVQDRVAKVSVCVPCRTGWPRCLCVCRAGPGGQGVCVCAVQDRVAKVSVYLMSRRHVRGTKASCMMLAALKSLTDNKVWCCICGAQLVSVRCGCVVIQGWRRRALSGGDAQGGGASGGICGGVNNCDCNEMWNNFM